MDYTALAEELLDVRSNLLQVPAIREPMKLMRGESFALNYLLTHNGFVYPKELSAKLVVSSARIASLLNNMEEKQYIIRKDDPQDDRQTVVELTEEGYAIASEIRTKAIQAFSSLLEELGPEEAECYVRIQKKIWSNHLQKIYGGSNHTD